MPRHVRKSFDPKPIQAMPAIHHIDKKQTVTQDQPVISSNKHTVINVGTGILLLLFAGIAFYVYSKRSSRKSGGYKY